MELTTSWKEEGKQEGLREGKQEGLREGKQEEAVHLTCRLLTRRIGLLPPDIEARIGTLSQTQLEQLFDAAYDFTSSDDLHAWLDNNTVE